MGGAQQGGEEWGQLGNKTRPLLLAVGRVNGMQRLWWMTVADL